MSAITTTTAAYPWRPDTTYFVPGDVVPTALLLQCSTLAGNVEGDTPAVRVAYVQDAESAGYVAEAAERTVDNPDLDEVVVHTRSISRLVQLSLEQYRQPQTAPQLSASVARDLVRKADNAFLGDAADQPSTGLLHVAGTVDGGEVSDSLDVLIDLLATLESNGATPSHIIVDPASWAALRKLKVGGDHINESLLGAGVTDAAPMLLSLPVLRSRFIPANSGVVVDLAEVVSAAGPVEVAVSEHAAFTSRSVMMMANWRIGWKVVRPDRLGTFTVASDGS